MAITLNYTTIDGAESKDDWETVGDGADLADSNYTPKEGSQCIEWDIAPNKNGGVRNKNTVTPFSIIDNEVSLWFLNPVVDKDGKYVIKNSEDGLYLRLYSSNGNYADYYQPQHRRDDGEWKGGWLYLRASGKAGDENSNSGTWTDDDCTKINQVAVMVNSGDGDSSDKDSGNFGTDWSKFYDKIIVTGDNDGTPYTLADIYATDIDKGSGGGVWGVVENAVGFYSLFAGLELGDGNSGSFKIENEYLYFSQLNNTNKFHLTVKDSFNLTLGVVDNGTEDYAKNGANITATGLPNFIIEDNAIVNIYDSKIQGFENIFIGNGNSVNVDILKSDLYNNNNIELSASGISIKNSRLYFSDDAKGDIGTLTNADSLENIEIFNSNNGLQFNRDFIVTKYKAFNNTYDILIQDDKSVELLDSEIDTTKIKRV